VRRIFYPVGVVFKGPGFYATDSRKAVEPKTAEKTGEKKSEPKAKPESKPAAKKEVA